MQLGGGGGTSGYPPLSESSILILKHSYQIPRTLEGLPD